MKAVHLQGSQKDLSVANRKSKSIPDKSKKALKSAKKNLNSEFATFLEGDALSESPKDSIDLSLLSEAVDGYQFGDSTESFVFPLLPEVTSSPENGVLSDLTSVSSEIASEMYTTSAASTYQCQNAEAKTYVDTEMALTHLRQALIQVMNHTDADLRSKKLLNAIIDVVVQGSFGLPKEKKCSDSLVLKKSLLVPLTFLLLIVAVFLGSLLSSSGTQPFLGPLPT